MFVLIITWFAGPLEPSVDIGPFQSSDSCWAYVRTYLEKVPAHIEWVSTCRGIPDVQVINVLSTNHDVRR